MDHVVNDAQYTEIIVPEIYSQIIPSDYRKRAHLRFGSRTLTC